MKDFLKIVQIIETDNDGWFAIRGMLTADKIVWTRSVGEKVYVMLSADVDLRHVTEYINKIHNSFNN